MKRHRSLSLALCAGLASLALALPGIASADSLVYTNVADWNIWVSAPDGSQARPITTDGSTDVPWRYPSQADDGTVLATHDGTIVRMDRQGHALNTVESVVGGPVNGPYDPKISPDGTKLGYTVYVQSGYQTPGHVYLDIGFYTVWHDARTGALIGDMTSSWESVSWLADSQHALVFDPYAYLTHQLGVAPVGAGNHDVTGWLISNENPIGAGELTRAEDRLALVQAPASNELPTAAGNAIHLYAVHGHSGETVGDECTLTGTDGSAVRYPSWSPDGRSISWWDNHGTWTSSFDGTCGSIAPRNVLPTGAQADWGPAGPGSAAAGGAGAGAANGGGGGKTAGRTKVSLARSVKVGALRKGLRVKVRCAGVCTARLTVKDGKRTIARRTAKIPARGATVRVKLPAAARRKLGRRGHRKLIVNVDAGGAKVRKLVTVKR